MVYCKIWLTNKEIKYEENDEYYGSCPDGAGFYSVC